MKNRLVGLAAIAGSVLLCVAAPAFGQTVVTFTGGEVNPSNIFDNYAYEDPYTGTVTQNGNPTVLNNGTLYASGPNAGSVYPQIVCDDFNDEIFPPTESWQATPIEASSLTSGNIDGSTLFGKTIGLNGYAAVASLVSNMLTYPSDAPDDSEAIWYITSLGDGAGGSGSNLNINGYGLSSTAAGLVQTLLTEYGTLGNGATTTESANSIAELDGATNLWILKPIDGTQTPSSDTPNPQEMWIETNNSTSLVTSSVPEGGAGLLYLLLGGASCFGAMFLASRGRVGRTVTA